MKKLLLVVLLLVGMALSFAAIALVMLFASGAVQNFDQVKTIVTGEITIADSSMLGGDEVSRVQDALILLQQQKQTMQQDYRNLQIKRDALALTTQALADSLTAISDQGKTAGANQSEDREQRLQEIIALYSAMRPGDAAVIMDKMSDEMILKILPGLKGRQRAKILSALPDDQRKADLTAKLLD